VGKKAQVDKDGQQKGEQRGAKSKNRLSKGGGPTKKPNKAMEKRTANFRTTQLFLQGKGEGMNVREAKK